jgi:hypothetical protein
MSCSVSGCVRPTYARSWCKVHYSRWSRTGSTESSAPKVGVEYFSDPDGPGCAVAGCGGTGIARGLCPKHYARWRTHGTTDPPVVPAPRFCSVEGCDAAHKGHGLCDKHLLRQRNYGDPLIVHRIRGDDLARFMQYVDQTGPVPALFWDSTEDSYCHRPDAGPCWLWTGVRHKTRHYGRFTTGGRRGGAVQAHRWSYEHSVGPIPEGREIDHLCCVTPCVNPTHLEAVAPRENKRRQGLARRRPQPVEGSS